MGVMRFLVHPPDKLRGTSEPAHAYLSGMDGRIFPTKVEYSDNVITFRRPMSDSCKLNIAWPVPGLGRPVLATTSLRERDQPYELALELARGKLSEIRESSAMWEQAGMLVPDAFRKTQREAFEKLAKASTAQTSRDLAADLASQSIEKSCQASAILMDAYTIQRLTNIRRTRHQSPGLLGCVVDETLLTEKGSQIFRHAFNTASVPVNWKVIEPNEGEYHWDAVDQLVAHGVENRYVLRGGPLIDLSPGGLPEWLSPWSNDFLNLPSFVCDYIETAVARYQGMIRLWEVSAYGNTGGALGLGEDHCLALVARTLETAKRTDSDAQFFIRIERPWGEYQRLGRHRLSPFQFVDALVRSNLGLAGVTLDVNIGYGPDGCYARDMLSISKLIDFWSLLQVQIHVNVACPSSSVADPHAGSQYSVYNGVWRNNWDQEAQAEWIEHVVPVLLAKPSVTGVFLSNFHDALPHRYPHAGLLDAKGEPKQMYDPLRRQLNHDLS
ncbi:endo-1,4-beta-xylanase [Planctomicrobium piriforme]|uniref:Glycosyl hydrolase family 10 n=1 Tax=Planctomicrobium piriforme TaxID=1576369 RepID=A0A1I3E8M5_9PLAN|nr:endo-1,4-beta-xylanase [Planctomicrobium piriforme]SFH95238.1 Glycosyl hydrolase family 10 [Planctomicrobium piriforme]